jgi:histidinol-phosphate aminotransferase
MRAYTPGEQVNDCLKLNTNECAWAPSPAVLECLQAVASNALRLYPDPVSLQLRKLAAELWGHPAAGILAGNGSDDCLTILYRSSLNADDSVCVPWPTYGLYDTLAAIQDVTIQHVDWEANWSLPTAAILNSGAKMVLIANPNNPSSTLVPREQLAALAKAFDGLVVVDEAYGDYAPADSSCAPLLAEYQNMVVLRTCSKSYSLAGARLGFCLGQPELIAQLMKVKDSYNVNSLTQAVGFAALNDRNYHANLVKNTLAARDELIAGISKLGWEIVPSTGNFILTKVGPKAEAIYLALKKAGILVRWWSSAELRDYLRITVGKPEDQARVLNLLQELDT